MGACAKLLTVSPQLIQLFKQQPLLTEPFVLAQMTFLYEQPDNDDIQAIYQLMPTDADFILAQAKNKLLNLDKIWPEVCIGLTGKDEATPTPLGQCILGGCPIGKDLGYGELRYLEPENVKLYATALAELTIPTFKKQLKNYGDPDFMEDEDIDEVKDLFKELRLYYKKAAKEQQALLLYLS